MATFNKFNSFVEALAEKTHNLGSDTIKLVLCSSSNAPTSTHSQLSQLTTVSLTSLSTATNQTITISASSQTGGTYSLVASDKTITANSTGSIGPFKYVVLYNDTASNDELIGYYNYGSGLTLNSGESLILDFGSSLLTIV